MHQRPSRAYEAQVHGLFLPEKHRRREGDVVAVEEGIDGRIWRYAALVIRLRGRKCLGVGRVVRIRSRADANACKMDVVGRCL